MIYLDYAATAKCLPCAWDAMMDAEATFGNIHRSGHDWGESTTQAYEQARRVVADFIGAYPDEIIFTSGATAGLNMLARMLGKSFEFSRIANTVLDHSANHYPWRELARVKGVPFQQLNFQWPQLCENSLLAFPVISNVLGCKVDIDEIVENSHTIGFLTVADATQSVSRIPTDVEQMGVDALVFSGHKLHGPTGIGVLYINRDLKAKLQPSEYGSGEFEVGTPPILQAIGLASACQYWTAYGFEQIGMGLESMSRRLVDGLSQLKRVLPLSPYESHGIVSFLVDGAHPHDVADALNDRGIAVRAGTHCCEPLHEAIGASASVRVSVSPHNTPYDIDAFLDAMKDLYGTE